MTCRLRLINFSGAMTPFHQIFVLNRNINYENWDIAQKILKSIPFSSRTYSDIKMSSLYNDSDFDNYLQIIPLEYRYCRYMLPPRH